MTLEDDRREYCQRCGWVGRRAFQRDRHDLCEPLADETPAEKQLEPVMIRENKRPGRRPRAIRPKKTVAVRRITQLALAAGRDELRVLGADGPYDRPKTRGDCQWCAVCQAARDGKTASLQEKLACGHRVAEIPFRSRPCVFVSCKYSSFLDVAETGSLIFNFPHREPTDMPVDGSCALDLAERGGMTLEEVGAAQALTRERVRQVEVKALHKLGVRLQELGIDRVDVEALLRRYVTGPGGELADSGADGELPSDVATLLLSK